MFRRPKPMVPTFVSAAMSGFGGYDVLTRGGHLVMRIIVSGMGGHVTNETATRLALGSALAAIGCTLLAHNNTKKRGFLTNAMTGAIAGAALSIYLDKPIQDSPPHNYRPTIMRISPTNPGIDI